MVRYLKRRCVTRWQAGSRGKFLPLTSRPWSLNSFTLSKIWYKASCIDFRIGDTDSITSSVKGWLYQDLLVKPQEMMLFRTTELGGLGLYNPRLRSLAMLIHNFLLQAVCPAFPTNFYLHTLYRWHVLGERMTEDPGRPPYYSADFFSIIREVYSNTPLNIAWISLKQWYRILLEKGLTHNTEEIDAAPLLIPSRLEESCPDRDFANTYHMCRVFGLTPEQKSFLFRMLQNLLPTKERLHRLGKMPTPACRLCNHPEDTLEHFISCPYSIEVTRPLLACLSAQAGNLTPRDLVQLNVPTSESWRLPAAWLISSCLSLTWENRLKGSRTSLTSVKSELLAKLAVMKCTKGKHYQLQNSAVLLDEAINLHFV